MNLKNTILVLALSAACLTACKKDNGEKEPEQAQFEQVSKYIKKYTTGLVEVTQLPLPDTISRRARSYFSFDKMDFVDASKVMTQEWDFHIRGLEASVIWPNNGVTVDEEQPWYENTARVNVKSIFKKFDEVNEVPSDMVFDNDKNNNVISTAGYDREPYTLSAFYWAYDAYDIDGVHTHYIPYTNRTHIFKLTDGRYVKFQMINTYNNTPDKNSATSRKGYLSFRYIISKAGSKDLKTK